MIYQFLTINEQTFLAGLFFRRMLSEPDISKLNLLTQFAQQSLAPPAADKPCKSNENSPVMPRRHERNVSCVVATVIFSFTAHLSLVCIQKFITHSNSFCAELLAWKFVLSHYCEVLVFKKMLIFADCNHYPGTPKCCVL